jgi:hypothetical protein
MKPKDVEVPAASEPFHGAFVTETAGPLTVRAPLHS